MVEAAAMATQVRAHDLACAIEFCLKIRVRKKAKSCYLEKKKNELGAEISIFAPVFP